MQCSDWGTCHWPMETVEHWPQMCRTSSWKRVRKSSGWLWSIKLFQLLLLYIKSNSSVQGHQGRVYFTRDSVVRLLFGPVHIQKRRRWQCKAIILIQYECPSFWSSQSQNDDVTGMFRGHLRPTVRPLKNRRLLNSLFSNICKIVIYHSRLKHAVFYP